MQSTVKRMMLLFIFFLFFSFYAFHCGLHSAVHGEKANAFLFLINFLFCLLILNVFLFSYQTFMTRILGFMGYPVNLDLFSFSSLVFFFL